MKYMRVHCKDATMPLRPMLTIPALLLLKGCTGIPRALQVAYIPDHTGCVAPLYTWCEANRACVARAGSSCVGPDDQCMAWDNGCTVCRARVEGRLVLSPPLCAQCEGPRDAGGAPIPMPMVTPGSGQCIQWNVPQERTEVRVVGQRGPSKDSTVYDIYVTGGKHEAVMAVFGDDDSPLCVPAAFAGRSHIGLADGSSVGMDSLDTQWSPAQGACVTDGASFVVPSADMDTGETLVGHVEMQRGQEGTITLSVQFKDTTTPRTVRLVRGLEATLRGPTPGAPPPPVSTWH